MLPFDVTDRYNAEESPDDFALKPHREWNLSGVENVEVIPELKCLAPRGLALPTSMDLANFDILPAGASEPPTMPAWADFSDVWAERTLRTEVGTAKYLLFYDGRGGYIGQVTGFVGTGEYAADPNFGIRLFRYATPRNAPAASNSWVEIQLLGIPTAEHRQWTLVLPGGWSEGTRGYKYPKLGQRTNNEDGSSGPWTPVAEVRKAISESQVGHLKPLYQWVTWETVDGHFVINIDGSRLVYAVPQEYRPADRTSPTLNRGFFRIIVANAPAAVNISKMSYPTATCYAERQYEVDVDSSVFNADATEANSNKYHVSWEPAYAGGLANVIVTAEHQSVDGNIRFYKPKVGFTATDKFRRAVCYLAQVDFPPTVSAGTSSSYATDGNDVLVSAHGELSNDWRSNSCDLTLNVPATDADALVANWKGNNKVTVTAGWDQTGTDSDTASHFYGNIASMDVSYDPRDGRRVYIDLNCVDGFRRLEKKYWQHLGNFTGWELHTMFRRVLNQCGIPNANIKIWDQSLATPALVLYDSFTGTTPIIDVGTRRSEMRYQFRESQDVIGALNVMVNEHGWKWGQDESGFWFIKPPPTYSAAVGPDWTLDDDSTTLDLTTGARAIHVYDATPMGKPFVNNVFVMGQRGDETLYSWRRDEDSHQLSSAANFIGDDWWTVEAANEGEDPDVVALKIIEDRLQRTKMLEFEATPTDTGSSNKTLVELMPDHFIKVQATGLNIATDSIFQIVRKSWWCSDSPTDLTYRASFTAKFVQ